MDKKNIEIKPELIAKLAREILLIERDFSNNDTEKQTEAIGKIKKAIEKEVK